MQVFAYSISCLFHQNLSFPPKCASMHCYKEIENSCNFPSRHYLASASLLHHVPACILTFKPIIWHFLKAHPHTWTMSFLLLMKFREKKYTVFNWRCRKGKRSNLNTINNYTCNTCIPSTHSYCADILTVIIQTQSLSKSTSSVPFNTKDFLFDLKTSKIQKK